MQAKLSDAWMQRFAGIGRLYGQHALHLLHVPMFVSLGLVGSVFGPRRRLHVQVLGASH